MTSNVKWPLTFSRSNKSLLLSMGDKCTKYEICPSLTSGDGLYPRFHIWPLLAINDILPPPKYVQFLLLTWGISITCKKLLHAGLYWSLPNKHTNKERFSPETIQILVLLERYSISLLNGLKYLQFIVSPDVWGIPHYMLYTEASPITCNVLISFRYKV